MSDPVNQLPANPDWLHKVDTLTEFAAKHLACMVVLIAVQPDGKLCVSVDGIPPGDLMAEIASDVPRLLFTLGQVLAAQEESNAKETRQ